MLCFLVFLTSLLTNLCLKSKQTIKFQTFATKFDFSLLVLFIEIFQSIKFFIKFSTFLKIYTFYTQKYKYLERKTNLRIAFFEKQNLHIIEIFIKCTPSSSFVWTRYFLSCIRKLSTSTFGKVFEIV